MDNICQGEPFSLGFLMFQLINTVALQSSTPKFFTQIASAKSFKRHAARYNMSVSLLFILIRHIHEVVQIRENGRDHSQYSFVVIVFELLLLIYLDFHSHF